MAKAKKQLAGNWELVSGGVFHKSWAGVIFRSRGSAGAYYEGCIFPRPPEVPPPPPPPVEHVVWRIRIYSDTASGMSSMTIERMTENEYSIHSVEIDQAIGGIGTITVITEILELTLNGAHVRKRVIEEFDGIIIADFTLEAIVPPFNGLNIRWGALIHEQVHEL
jgi:hypothetical protein